jgi:hypothetical protein
MTRARLSLLLLAPLALCACTAPDGTEAKLVQTQYTQPVRLFRESYIYLNLPDVAITNQPLTPEMQNTRTQELIQNLASGKKTFNDLTDEDRRLLARAVAAIEAQNDPRR